MGRFKAIFHPSLFTLHRNGVDILIPFRENLDLIHRNDGFVEAEVMDYLIARK
jgi:hypothetical protein